MSKRYGRGQKRRAKETEAQLRADVARWEGMVGQLRRQLNRAEGEARHLGHALDDVRASLGPAYYGLPTGELVHKLREKLPQYRSWLDFMPPGGISAPMRLQILQADVVINDPRQWVGMRIMLDGLIYGYGISEAALHEAPPEYLADFFAREASRQLVEQLRTLRRPADARL